MSEDGPLLTGHHVRYQEVGSYLLIHQQSFLNKRHHSLQMPAPLLSGFQSSLIEKVQPKRAQGPQEVQEMSADSKQGARRMSCLDVLWQVKELRGWDPKGESNMVTPGKLLMVVFKPPSYCR